jgi:putative transposase
MGRLRHRTGLACTYFVTTKTWQNRELFKVTDVAEIVVRRLVQCRDEGAYRLHEFVLMPNHLHALLTLSNTTSLEKAMQLIKGGSSFSIHRLRDHAMQIWMSGFHDWTIRDGSDYQTKREYIWMNPVQAGLVGFPGEWSFGSASGKFELDDPPTQFTSGFSG